MSVVKRAFIDTNIWIYQLDRNEALKQKILSSFLMELSERYRSVISTQILNEFFNTIIKKLSFDPRDAKEALKKLYLAEIVVMDRPQIERAIDIEILNRISHWNALMISAAEFGQCSIIVTEDLNHGQKFGEIEIINPFKGIPPQSKTTASRRKSKSN